MLSFIGFVFVLSLIFGVSFGAALGGLFEVILWIFAISCVYALIGAAWNSVKDKH